MKQNLINKALKIANKKIIYQQDYDCAKTILEQILKVDEKNIEALHVLSQFSKEYIEKLENTVREKIQELSKNQSVESSLITSQLYLKLDEVDESIEILEKANLESPNNVEILKSLANCYNMKSDYNSCIKFLKESLKLKDECESSVNLGIAYQRNRQVKEAIDHFKNLIKKYPKNSLIHFSLSNSLLCNKNFKEGWKHYKHRFHVFKGIKLDFLKMKYHLLNKRIKENDSVLVISEQGTGDIFNFIRFKYDLKSKYPNNNIKLLIRDELYDLFKEDKDVITLKEISNYKFNYWCALLDIPGFLKLSAEDIKNNYKPYIKSSKKCDYSSCSNNYKIGICWAGNAMFSNDRNRSCHLKEFKVLMNFPNVKLFSLQKDNRTRKWNGIKGYVNLSDCSEIRAVDMSPFMKSWDDTAAIIDGLDLVISVDTAILHLAGAMNKKTFGLIPFSPDWRWGLDSEETFWYPSVKLFRQEKIGDWTGVFKKITADLNIY